MSVRTKRKYLDWTPVPHSFIRDEKSKNRIHTEGFEILDLIESTDLEKLKSIFEREHQFNVKDGGMFYSMYSKDLDYRKRVHDDIGDVLKPYLDKLFTNYKNVINAFVVKLPGEKSEFYVHQDTTGLDEFKFSPLSLWIPLADVNEENGALAIIEKSHWFFSPYRGVSFRFPFKNIMETIREYLRPIKMIAGQALMFDNRMIHNSSENKSDQIRVAIICGIFPKEARYQNCYQENEDSAIEVYEHEDDFLLKNPHFFYNCTDRPQSGEIIKKVEELFPYMNAEEFIELCTLNNIEKSFKTKSASENTTNCQLIAEPDGINKFDEVHESLIPLKNKKSFSFKSLFKFS